MQKLAEAKGKMDEFHLYETVEEVSKRFDYESYICVINRFSANVDFTVVLYILCLVFRENYLLRFCDCPYFRMECTSSGEKPGKQGLELFDRRTNT